MSTGIACSTNRLHLGGQPADDPQLHARYVVACYSTTWRVHLRYSIGLVRLACELHCSVAKLGRITRLPASAIGMVWTWVYG